MNVRVAACLIACAIGLTAWATAPDAGPFEAQAMPSGAMAAFPGDPVGKPVPVAEGRAQLLRPVIAVAGPLRQLHFSLPPGREGAALYLPAAPSGVGLWVNGRVGAGSVPARYFGPGFGPESLAIEIPGTQLNFETNRIDILYAQGWRRGAPPLILASPARNGPAFAAMMTQVQARLSFGALAFGGAGFAVSLAGLLLLRSRTLYAGGAMFALALLDCALGAAPVWLRLAIAATGIAALLAGKGWRHPLLGGAMMAAAAALLAAGALWANWSASLGLAWGASVALWPLAGIALPALALREGRTVWSDFIAARTRLSQQATLIAQQQDKLEESIRAQAISEERQRFVRDMHDGVGGHLLSLLMRVRADDADKQDVADELEKGLTDLRLMADSLDHVGQNLDLALAAFRRRAGQQLASAGLAFDWTQPQPLSNFPLDARAVLSLFRIMQEALSNTIRHAGASRFGVTFEVPADGRRLNIVIEDDGKGFVPDASKEGRGLANIRKRGDALGSAVAIGQGAGGTGCRIMLSIPAA